MIWIVIGTYMDWIASINSDLILDYSYLLRGHDVVARKYTLDVVLLLPHPLPPYSLQCPCQSTLLVLFVVDIHDMTHGDDVGYKFEYKAATCGELALNDQGTKGEGEHREAFTLRRRILSGPSGESGLLFILPASS